MGKSISAFAILKFIDKPNIKTAAIGFLDSNMPAAISSPNVGASELIRDNSVVNGAETIIKNSNAGNTKSNRLKLLSKDFL